MARNLSITIDTKEVIALLRKSPEIYTKKIVSGLQKVGRIVETAVKDDMTKSGPWHIIPRKVGIGRIRGPIVSDSVDTGALRASVSHKVSGMTAEISSNSVYAPAIEYGSRGTVPRRHFRNTVKKQKSNVVQIIKNSLK